MWPKNIYSNLWHQECVKVIGVNNNSCIACYSLSISSHGVSWPARKALKLWKWLPQFSRPRPGCPDGLLRGPVHLPWWRSAQRRHANEGVGWKGLSGFLETFVGSSYHSVPPFWLSLWGFQNRRGQGSSDPESNVVVSNPPSGDHLYGQSGEWWGVTPWYLLPFLHSLNLQTPLRLSRVSCTAALQKMMWCGLLDEVRKKASLMPESRPRSSSRRHFTSNILADACLPSESQEESAFFPLRLSFDLLALWLFCPLSHLLWIFLLCQLMLSIGKVWG